MRKIKVFIAMGILYNIFKLLPVQKKILFEASQGRFSSNPKYLYLALEDDSRFGDFDLVWALIDSNNPQINTPKVKIYSVKYLYHLATAQVLVNDNMWHPSMKKRKQQVFIQTWHGTPLKKIAKDTNNPTNDRSLQAVNDAYVQANSRLFDCMISSSQYTTEKFKSAFDFNQTILECGTPRVDYLINNQTTYNDHPYCQFEQVILIAPSFRKTLRGQDQYQFFVDNFNLPALADKFPQYAFLVKLHNYAFATNHGSSNNIFDVSGVDDITELYLQADCLVTDYSSAMFDFSVLNKSNICFPFDYDFKSNLITTDNEPLYIDIDSNNLPVQIAQGWEHLVELLDQLATVAPNNMTEFECGNSSTTIANYILEKTKGY